MLLLYSNRLFFFNFYWDWKKNRGWGMSHWLMNLFTKYLPWISWKVQISSISHKKSLDLHQVKSWKLWLLVTESNIISRLKMPKLNPFSPISVPWTSAFILILFYWEMLLQILFFFFSLKKKSVLLSICNAILLSTRLKITLLLIASSAKASILLSKLLNVFFELWALN